MSATTAKPKESTSAAKEGTDPPAPPPKPPAPAPEPPVPAPLPVLAEDEVKQMRDLGLGRGVDGTNQTPWLSKSSFQVRDVSMKSIMGTDEGGSLHSYVKDVSSVRSRQSTLTASIQVPKAPVTIGVDGEYSRSYNTSKKSIGQKVINRTVSFKAVFDDLSTDHTQSKTPPGKDEGEGTPSTHYSFEERLCKWILDEVRPQGGGPKPPTEAAEIQPVPEATPKPPPQPTPQPKPQPQPTPQPEPQPQPTPQPTPQPSTSPVEELAAFLKTATADELKAIDEQCRRFVYHFRNTHYVSAIELGAARYQVLEDDEYYGKLGGGSKLQVDKFGSGNFTASASWKKAVKNSTLSTIGVMTQQGTRWTVARKDEAVVGVQIQPISNLVRLPQLKTSLQTALVNYMKQQQDDREGPFYLSCNDDHLFMKVTADFTVICTPKFEEADEFYIIPTYDGEHPHEFAIVYYDKPVIKSLDPVPRYLNAPVGCCGKNVGPLRMKFDVKAHNSRLALHSRLEKSFHPVEKDPWISGRDIFYINCARRGWKRNAYVCVRGRGGQYITACVPSTEEHNEERHVFMLFRLIHPGDIKGSKKPHAATTTRGGSPTGSSIELVEMPEPK